MTSLGLPNADEAARYRDEAKMAVMRIAMADPAKRVEAASDELAAYVGAPHADERCDELTGALAAFAGDNPDDELIGKQQLATLIKAFRKSLTKAGKAERGEKYRAAIAREAELTEAVYVDRVSTERLEGRYVFSTGFGWMQYTGTHWMSVDTQVVCEEVRQHAVDLVAELLQAHIRDPKELMTLMKKTFITNVVSLAEGVMMISPTRFDASPDLLNVANGTIDLRTGALYPHNPDDYFTKCAPTPYVPGATDPAWDSAISSMDDETRAWMQLRYGNAVTGYPADDHRMCFLNGSGGNGKSMHLDGIGNTLGSGKSGYYASLSDGALVSKNQDKEATMSFRGTRLAVIEELPEGRQLNVASLKRIIGTARMTGRHLYQKEVTWDVSHSLVVTSNYDLNVSETDDGTWRRLAKVPFPFTYVDEPTAAHERVKDLTLSNRLKSASARTACLGWLVAGAVRWYSEGLVIKNTPAPVRQATDAWRGDSDMVMRFFEDHLVPARGHHVATSDLMKVFNASMGDQSQSEWSQKTFTSRAKDHVSFRKAGAELRSKVSSGVGVYPIASRKASGGYGMDSLPAQYSAFVGVRFRTAEDDIQPDPVEPSGVVEVDPDDQGRTLGDTIPRLAPMLPLSAVLNGVQVELAQDAIELVTVPQTGAGGFEGADPWVTDPFSG